MGALRAQTPFLLILRSRGIATNHLAPQAVTVDKPEEQYFREALQYEGVLRAYLFRYAPNPADVDELLQETYARLLGLPATESAPIRSVRAFALTVARNVALDWIRHQRVVPVDLVADMAALDVLDERAKIDEIVSSREELELLADVVQELPRRCRQAFTLRRVYGLGQKEIAKELGISENTVEQLLTRAVRRCADALFERQGRVEEPDSLSARLRRRLRR
jgi:RNA polymerase sigma factor (sigma-70 family)